MQYTARGPKHVRAACTEHLNVYNTDGMRFDGEGGQSADLSHAHNTGGKHPVLLPGVHVLLQLIGTLALCQRHVAAIPSLHLLLHFSLLLGKERLIAQKGVVSLIHLSSSFFLIVPFSVQLHLLNNQLPSLTEECDFLLVLKHAGLS